MTNLPVLRPVFSPLVPDTGSGGPAAAFIQIDALTLAVMAAGTIGIGWATTCSGRNLSYRKKVFDEIGGFSEISSFVSGDDDLFLHTVRSRTAWNTRYAVDPQAAVPSYVTGTLRSFFNQRTRHALKIQGISGRHKTFRGGNVPFQHRRYCVYRRTSHFRFWESAAGRGAQPQNSRRPACHLYGSLFFQGTGFACGICFPSTSSILYTSLVFGALGFERQIQMERRNVPPGDCIMSIFITGHFHPHYADILRLGAVLSHRAFAEGYPRFSRKTICLRNCRRAQ